MYIGILIDLGGGIECTPRKYFVGTQLSDGTDSLEDQIQIQNDLDEKQNDMK